MKRYEFRLEAVMKIRRMAEERCKQELGQLMVFRTKKQSQIDSVNADIQSTYKEQETALARGGLKGYEIRSYPENIEARRATIKTIQQDITKLDKQIEFKRHELAEKRAELKVIEKMKEKDFEKYRKEFNKDQNEKLEEQVMLWQENLKSQSSSRD